MKVLTNKKTSENMMTFAWGLEIILCITGLFTAFALTYMQLKGNSDTALTFSQWTILGSAALPLVGIAFAELMKIPFTSGLLYSKSYVTKAVALSGLILICGLTFETMVSGQEQLLNAQQKIVKGYKKEINALSDKIELIDNQITSLNSITPKSIREKANAGIQEQLKAINEQILDLDKSRVDLENSMNPAEISEMKRQILSYENSSNELIEDKNSQLEVINNELNDLNDAEQQELLNKTFGKTRIKDQYSQRRNEIKEEKNSINQNFKNDLDKINRKILVLNNKIIKLSIPSSDVKVELDLISNQISDARLEKSNLIKRVNKEIERDVALWENKQNKIDTLLLEKSELSESLNHNRELVDSSSGESFIHRLAGIYYGVDNLADLTEEQSGFFSLLFMISVAAVVSIAGPILTYVAYSLHLQETSPKKSKLLSTIRKMIIDLRKRIRDPKIVKEIKEIEKEIIKEIPVEKIVHKEVEVPKPVEIPLFVQVPVPTDPKDLPKMEEVTPEQMRPIASNGGIN